MCAAAGNRGSLSTSGCGLISGIAALDLERQMEREDRAEERRDGGTDRDREGEGEGRQEGGRDVVRGRDTGWVHQRG